MKLLEFKDYGKDVVWGYNADILKFNHKSLIQLCIDGCVYKDFPSIMIQIGPSDVLYISIGLVKFTVSITLWGRHYD